MPLTWHRRPLVGVDLATIGSDPETARMTAAAVVRYGGGRDTEVRSWAVTAHDRAPAAAVIEELLDALTARVEAGWPLVICDAPFALTVLEREAARYGLVPLSVRAEALRVLDPRVLDKEVDKFRRGSRTLESLCQHWRVKLADGSQVADRAKAVCALVWKLANRHRRLTRPGLPELHRRAAERTPGVPGGDTRQGTPGRRPARLAVLRDGPGGEAVTGRSLIAAVRRYLMPGPALAVVAPSYDEASLALTVADADVVTFAYCPRQQRRTAHALSDDGGRRCFDCGFERNAR